MSKQVSALSVPFVKIEQHQKSFYLVSLSAADVVSISYVARRGESEEQGAVQRLLNPARISSIRDFVLAGGVFPTSIVLNWVTDVGGPVIEGSNLILPRKPQSAQIIDGQHRVIGLSSAIEKRASIAGLQLPVSLYAG